MNRPKYVYSVRITNGNQVWVPYYYDFDNAVDKAIELIKEMGYSEEDIYSDNDGDTEHFFVEGVDDPEDPDLDIEVAYITPWFVKDHDTDLIMTGLEELKNAYEIIKNEYGYLCKSISMPYEDNEYTKFVFEYQGFPIKHSFSYLLYESPYGENDDVEFFDSENEVVYTVAQLFAITNFIKIIQDNRDNKAVMNEFIKYLENSPGYIRG